MNRETFERLTQKTLSDSTLRVYWVYWGKFLKWMKRSKTPRSVKDKDMAAFIDYLGNNGASYATLRIALSAVRHLSAQDGCAVSAGILTEISLRERGRSEEKPRKVVTPISPAILEQLIIAEPRSIANVRDNALFMLAFCAALTRKEIETLKIDSFEVKPKGIIYTPDQVISTDSFTNLPIYIPAGSYLGGIALHSFKAWISVQPPRGSLFTRIDRHGNRHSKPLTGQAIQDIVRRAAKRAGLPGSLYTVRSLRRGFAEACEKAGVESHVMRAHMRMRDDRNAKPINEPKRGFENSPLNAIKRKETYEPGDL